MHWRNEEGVDIIRFSARFFTGLTTLGENKNNTNKEKQWRTRNPSIFQKWWSVTLILVNRKKELVWSLTFRNKPVHVLKELSLVYVSISEKEELDKNNHRRKLCIFVRKPFSEVFSDSSRPAGHIIYHVHTRLL